MTPHSAEIQLDLLPAGASPAPPDEPFPGPPPASTHPTRPKRLRNLLWGFPQWALVFWLFQREVHWIHALCVTALMAWVRWIALPAAVRIRGPLREKPRIPQAASAVRFFYNRFWSMDACQNMTERLWIAGLGVLPVAALHWGFLRTGSLEMAELACFGYLYNAMVLCLLHDSPELESDGFSISLLGISAAWGARFYLGFPVLLTVFVYASLLLIPLSALLWLRLTVEASVHRERIARSAVLLALYLWTGAALVTAFGLACEQRETLYRTLFQIHR